MPPSRHGALEDSDAAFGQHRTRVWDLPTRLFHWALACAVMALIVTGTLGVMEWHFRIGYVVMALLLFRMAWGFIGGRWSRFRAFLYAPGSVLAYLRGRAHPDHLIGHNPAGAFSVFALLGILTLQVATGLMADDEIAAAGPLTRFVSEATVKAASKWHVVQGKWIIITLASLHVLAVLFYVLVKRHQLVRPMISGDKLTSGTVAPSLDTAGTRLMALVVFMLCMSFAWWISTLRS